MFPRFKRDLIAILGRNLVIRTTGRERESDIDSGGEDAEEENGTNERSRGEKPERKREGQESLC